MDDNSKKWLEMAAKGSGEKIEASDMFVSLFSKCYLTDPLCALQLGIAIMEDKPIALMLMDDERIPGHLKKIAFAIERVKDRHPESLKAAYLKIEKKLEALKKKKKKK